MSRDEKMVTVEIDEEGNYQVEAHGFVGTECESVAQEIGDALGQRTSVERKREYYQRAGNQQQQRSGN